MCVWSAENLLRLSKHTVMVYFLKKNKVQRENYKPIVSYVIIYTEVSYKSFYLDRGGFCMSVDNI